MMSEDFHFIYRMKRFVLARTADYARRNLNRDMAVDPLTGVAYHPGVTVAVADFFGRRVTCYEGYWVVRKSSADFEDVQLR